MDRTVVLFEFVTKIYTNKTTGKVCVDYTDYRYTLYYLNIIFVIILFDRFVIDDQNSNTNY